MLLALLINNVQLPGAIDGITFFILPEWEKLLSVEVKKQKKKLSILPPKNNKSSSNYCTQTSVES